MFKHQEVWLPDGEQHYVEWMSKSGEIVDGRGSYQIKKLRAALNHCKQFRTAVDVGANVGLWSMQLVKRFGFVHAFEPVEAHRACFLKNLVENDKFWLNPCALGDHEGLINITSNPTSCGDSRVDGDGDIPIRTLDSFCLQEVDFIKIDTEGFELYVIKGAEETIRRCRPTMIVEQKGHGMKYFGFRKEEGVELLESWGMRRAKEMSGDWVMVWD